MNLEPIQNYASGVRTNKACHTTLEGLFHFIIKVTALCWSIGLYLSTIPVEQEHRRKVWKIRHILSFGLVCLWSLDLMELLLKFSIFIESFTVTMSGGNVASYY